MDLPWIIASLSLLLLLVAALLWLRFGPKGAAGASLPTKWPLASRRVFGQEELQVYRRLRQALPDHVLLSKLPLVRFCQPFDSTEMRYWYELLSNQHVSFAVCSASGRVLLAIDLVGLRPTSRRSLAIKDSVLSACKVKYLRCTADELPSLAEIRSLVPESHSKSVPVERVARASEHLSATVATRRRERQGWADSNFAADSFFDEEIADGRVSSFDRGERAGLSVREVVLSPDDAVAAVVVEGQAPALRT